MAFWEDVNYNKLSKQQVDDRYLLNIICFIARGKGRLSFLNEDKIDDIYDEAILRGLKPKYTRSECKMAYRGKSDEFEEAFHSAMMKEIEQEFWHGQD